jgi:hypothetical protein
VGRKAVLLLGCCEAGWVVGVGVRWCV